MSLEIVVSSKPVAIAGKIVKYSRNDGLDVFLDGDKELDSICLNCDRKTVITAVAIRRAQQIAHNYAVKHAEDLIDFFNVGSLQQVAGANEEVLALLEV